MSLANDSWIYCRPSLGLGNADRTELLEGAVWAAPKSQKTVTGQLFLDLLSALSGARKYSQNKDSGGRRLGSTEITKLCHWQKTHGPTVGSLWGSEIQPQQRFSREASGEHRNRKTLSLANGSWIYCRPSLGLGKTARTKILEGAVWGSTEFTKPCHWPMIPGSAAIYMTAFRIFLSRPAQRVGT